MTDSELTRRADELRALAATCDTVQDFSRKTSFHIATAIHANTVLKLGLPFLRSNRSGAPRAGVECPKPVGKGKKAERGE